MNQRRFNPVRAIIGDGDNWLQRSLSKFFCLIGLHFWDYLPNIGVYYFRKCINCGKKQFMFTSDLKPFINRPTENTWVNND